MDGTPREIFSRRDELAEYRLAVPQITELCWQLSKRGAALPSGILHTMEAAMLLSVSMWRVPGSVLPSRLQLPDRNRCSNCVISASLTGRYAF